MNLNPSEISDLIKSRIQNMQLAAQARTEGTVVSVTDGICRVHGLADVMQGEMLEFPGNTFGLALNLERDSVGAVIMGADAMENPDGQATTSVNIEVDSIEDAERIFAAMSGGGEVRMPLAESQWALRFGMFDDRYGQPWMINLMKPAP